MTKEILFPSFFCCIAIRVLAARAISLNPLLLLLIMLATLAALLAVAAAVPSTINYTTTFTPVTDTDWLVYLQHVLLHSP